MKSLLLVRHAKSSWDSPSLQDYDRPLNDRGMKDAPMMAKRLKERKVTVDAFVSSTASRAFTTAALFAKEYNVKEKDIVKIPKLYHAMPSTINEVIEQLNDKWHTVALFTHNPGITEFINMIGVARIDNMPTCGVFGLHLLDDDWSNFAKAEKRFWLFDYPKNL
jgi:phosphohistidine phosphatase